MTDVCALQREVTRAISMEVDVAVGRAMEAEQGRGRGPVPEAYDTYLRGRYLQDRAQDGWSKSVNYFERAIAIDAAYAAAHAGLAEAYAHLGWGFGLTRDMCPSDAHSKARAAAMRALLLAPRLAEAHVASAKISWQYEWNGAVAQHSFLRAMQLDPNSVAVHEAYFDYLSCAERHADAAVEVYRALSLDPLSPTLNHDVAIHLARTQDLDRAVERMKLTLDLDPSGWTYHSLGELYYDKGMYRQAIAELEKALNLSPETAHFLAVLVQVHATAGDRVTALGYFDHLRRLALSRYVSNVDLAVANTGLGNTEEALDNLEAAYSAGDPRLSMLAVQSKLAELRQEPKFVGLVRRIRDGVQPDTPALALANSPSK